MNLPEDMDAALQRIEYHVGEITSWIEQMRDHWDNVNPRGCSERLLAEAQALVFDAEYLLKSARGLPTKEAPE